MPRKRNSTCNGWTNTDETLHICSCSIPSPTWESAYRM